jgi:hypothetical protein
MHWCPSCFAPCTCHDDDTDEGNFPPQDGCVHECEEADDAD